MNETVLLVEDELIATMDLQRIIEGEGLTPLGPCKSMKEVMRVATRTPPDLALIDIKLNGELGYDICSYLHWNFRTTCVYVTGNVDIARQNQKGALGIVAKPFSPAQIADVLNYMRAVREGHAAIWPRCLLRYADPGNGPEAPRP